MFLNAKLRLLMSLLKFERLGQENVEGISWVIPSELKSAELRDSKSVIDRALVVGNTNERDPSDLLRRKYGSGPRGNADQTTLDVNFGSDSEGEDVIPDGPLFPPNPRSKSKVLDELKKRRKRKNNGEKEPIDDETLEERRQAQLENTRSRLAKIKSDLYVHASDEESDEEGDQEFFRLEEGRRREQSERIKKALLLGRTEGDGDSTSKKKRGKRSSASSGREAGGKRRRHGPQASPEVEDEEILMSATGMLSRETSVTPSLDGVDGINKGISKTPEDELYLDDNLAFSRDREIGAEPHFDKEDDRTSSPKENEAAAEEDEEDAPMAAPGRRRMRAGFVVDSDSE